MEITHPIEAIDERCRLLDEQIAQSERRTTELKERRKRLHDARAVFMEELEFSSESSTSSQTVEEGTSTLREAVLQYVTEHAGSEGISASDVTNALSERKAEKVTPRVFYSMIYLTLMRLTEMDDLRFKKGPRGRLFMPKRVRLNDQPHPTA